LKIQCSLIVAVADNGTVQAIKDVDKGIVDVVKAVGNVVKEAVWQSM
jgi:hypothetical protein